MSDNTSRAPFTPRDQNSIHMENENQMSIFLVSTKKPNLTECPASGQLRSGTPSFGAFHDRPLLFTARDFEPDLFSYRTIRYSVQSLQQPIGHHVVTNCRQLRRVVHMTLTVWKLACSSGPRTEESDSFHGPKIILLRWPIAALLLTDPVLHIVA